MNSAQRLAVLDAKVVLNDILVMLASGTPVHPGALLSDNDCTIEENIEAALFMLSRTFPTR